MSQPTYIVETTDVIGRNIKLLRRLKGSDYRAADLAQDAKLSHNFVAQMELGQRNPSVGAMEQLASALGVSIATLVDRQLIDKLKEAAAMQPTATAEG